MSGSPSRQKSIRSMQAARAYWAGAHAGDGGDVPFLWFCRLTMLGMVRLLCQPKMVGTGALGSRPGDGGVQSVPRAALRRPAGRRRGLRKRVQELLSATGPLQPRLWTHVYLAALAQSAGLRVVSFDARFRIFGEEHCRILPSK